MALAAEVTFANALAVAEGVRQVAKAAAFTTWGFAPAGQATYIAAVLAADVAYITAVNTALNASGLTLGTLGIAPVSAVIPGRSANLST